MEYPIPFEPEGTGRDAGTDVNYLKELVHRWHNAYDWR
jgi:hypothetical protein